MMTGGLVFFCCCLFVCFLSEGPKKEGPIKMMSLSDLPRKKAVVVVALVWYSGHADP